MESLGSGDNHNQQQQEGGSCLDPQQQRRAGSIGGSRTVTFDAAAGSQQQQYKSRRLAPSGPPVHHSDSFLADGSHSSPSDIYARCVQAANLTCCSACCCCRPCRRPCRWCNDVWLLVMLTLNRHVQCCFTSAQDVVSPDCIHEMSLCFAVCFLCRPVAGGGGGFKAPLTRMVCTPCYRAPEVVMSRGGYTGAASTRRQLI
jgi:hypothetical protein